MTPRMMRVVKIGGRAQGDPGSRTQSPPPLRRVTRSAWFTVVAMTSPVFNGGSGWSRSFLAGAASRASKISRWFAWCFRVPSTNGW